MRAVMTRPANYFQLLVSPHMGGAEKLALTINEYVHSRRNGRCRAFVPVGGNAERVVRESEMPFWAYNLDRLIAHGRLRTCSESLNMAWQVGTAPGVVHVHSLAVYGALRVFRRLSRVKTVLHIHLEFTPEELRWALKSPPDLAIVCAEFMRRPLEEALEARHMGTHDVRVIRNAVDLGRFYPAEKEWAKRRIGADKTEFLAMIVANLAPHKGQLTAIRAIAELKKRGRRVQLWIVGECRDQGARYEEELRAECVSLTVTDLVRFTGFRTDTPDLFRAADFVLLPSTCEGLPLSLLEAQASGAVVIAAPTAGVPEIVADSITGYLVAHDDYAGYADRMEWLIDDRARTMQIVESAIRNVAENHELGNYCGRVLEEYDALLGRR